MAGKRQAKSREIQVFIISRSGRGDRWRYKIKAELRRRGALTARLADAQATVILITPELERTSGWQASQRERYDLVGQVSQALAADRPVIPILVDGARMPQSSNLPRKIQELSFQEALRINSETDLPGVMARVIAAGRASAGQQIPEITGRSLLAKTVFISYRRDDSSYWAGQLARELALRLGSDHVFLDVGSGRPGQDFRPEIEKRLRASTDVVVVMGAEFLGPDAPGMRRLDHPDDYVRQEIRMALSLQKRLHAVLVGQAEMPQRKLLPNDIAGLADAPSISRVGSAQEAAEVAERVARGSLQSLLGVRRSLSGLPTREMGSGRQGYEARAASIVSALSEHGWRLAEARGQRGTARTLTNGRFPNHRLRLEPGAAEVILEERVGGGRLLGDGKWVKRQLFSISPHLPDDLDLLRLPDRLLEAAIDPARFLDRVGRVDMSRGKPPPMGADRFYGAMREMVEPNAQAIKLYQRTRTKLAAQGGGRRLIHGGTISLPGEAEPRVVAGRANGNLLVVGTQEGVFACQGPDWRATPLKRRGSYQCADISQGGWIAAGSDDNKISVWDSNGTPLVKSATPYSLWRQLSGDEWIRSLSWSADGDLLACADGQSVWVYSASSRNFTRWELPTQSKVGDDYGVKFAGRGRELVAFAHSRYAWVVDATSGKVRGEIALAPRPMKLRSLYGRSSEAAQPQRGLPFHNLYQVDVSPDGRILACAGGDGQIMLYDLRSLKAIRLIAGHEPRSGGIWTMVEAVAFSPDGRWLASVANDNRLLVWNTATWEPAHEAAISWPPVRAGRRVMTWLADSSRIAGCAAIGELEIWQLGGL